MSEAPDGVTNPQVRAAVEAFAAEPNRQTSIDVLRACLHGQLLFDGTGSQISYTDGDESEIAEGSTISIAGGAGPDGRSALFAFTSHAQIQRMHAEDADGVEVISLVQAAAGVLEQARDQQAGWVYLDPAGPTCALSIDEIDFALRLPRNDAVRDAYDDGADRAELLAALHAAGQLLLGVAGAPEVPDGAVQAETEVELRTCEAPDGAGTALIAYTSGPEVVARESEDRIVAQTCAQILDRVRENGFAGLLINPAGPWVYLPAAELFG